MASDPRETQAEPEAKTPVGIGLVGAGFMGRCHAHAFRSVSGLFDLPLTPVARVLADATPEAARLNAAALGFARGTDNWRQLCSDPDVDIVAVTAPNALHEPIVMAAIEAGKTVYCEKPLSTTVASAERMAAAAEAAGTVTMVGFNFLRNPMVKLARDIIRSGELGEIVSFRGRHAENYMCDPDIAHSFRTDRNGGGAAADIGSHIVSMSRYLLGPIETVRASCTTIHPTRPVCAGSQTRTPVEVDDVTHALVRFANGARGSIEANWAAYGRTMDLSFEVTGTRGAIVFTQERMNELHIARALPNGAAGRFLKIEAGPEHAPYGQFCPAPGHHLGFNDLKIIEVAELLGAVAGGAACGPDFREGVDVQRVIEAMQTSAREDCTVTLA
ncbi:Gfo/Idh/MocA family protein [Pseudohoeflea coraliihabitans]|uniref:Gfo/Idh/MocA family oxidoreductase n=1 Tax=Pseudohoeflea coraliihabitans TaxID=2860393 RepID=A0ABS6WSU9_9HYPH|nr:Gfo/Idh/MocA family oxidoreductase [Pseudohoeflea sp. DP4N28-3]MBW3099036.1 Gfo/Idh/MocA family oxidoreductase [Pseudohoeflea sp. DP4N28-3]